MEIYGEKLWIFEATRKNIDWRFFSVSFQKGIHARKSYNISLKILCKCFAFFFQTSKHQDRACHSQPTTIMCFERMTLLRSQLLPGWLYVQGHSCSTHAKLSLQNFLLLQFSAYVLGMYDNCYTITFHSTYVTTRCKFLLVVTGPLFNIFFYDG